MLDLDDGPRPFSRAGAYAQYCSIPRRQPSYWRISSLSNTTLGKRRWCCGPNPAGHFLVQQSFLTLPFSLFHFSPKDLFPVTLLVLICFPYPLFTNLHAHTGYASLP